MATRKNLLQLLARKMLGMESRPEPVHVKGTNKGEELARAKGREPGRQSSGGKGYRAARDSTGINADDRESIHPDSPNIPPA